MTAFLAKIMGALGSIGAVATAWTATVEFLKRLTAKSQEASNQKTQQEIEKEKENAQTKGREK